MELEQASGNLLQNTLAQMGGGAGQGVSPDEYLNHRQIALYYAVGGALLESLAKSEGITVSDEETLALIERQIAERAGGEIQQIRQMYDSSVTSLQGEVDRAKVKGENTQEFKDAKKKLDEFKAKSFEEFFAEMKQKTLEQVEEDAKKDAENAQANPSTSEQTRRQIMQRKLVDKFGMKAATTDEAVRSSYDKITYRRIQIGSLNNADPKTKAETVSARLKAGMSFTDAVTQFSDEKGTKNQKPEFVGVMTEERLTLMCSPLSAMLDLKVNVISEPIEMPDGFVIVMMQKIVPSAPAKLEDVKKERVVDIRQRVGEYQLGRKVEEHKKSAKFEWSDDAWRLVWDYTDLKTGEMSKQFAGAANTTKRLAEYKKLLERTTTAAGDSTTISLVRYAVFSQIDADTPKGPEKDKLNEERLDIYKAVAEWCDSVPFRFEYVNLLIAAKQGDVALEELGVLALALEEPTEANLLQIKKIEDLLPKAANFATPGTSSVASIQSSLKAWHETYNQQKKEEAEFKKEQERLKKETEAAEAAKKAAENAKKTTPPKSNTKPPVKTP